MKPAPFLAVLACCASLTAWQTRSPRPATSQSLPTCSPGGGKTSDFPSLDAAREAIYKLDKDAVTAT